MPDHKTADEVEAERLAVLGPELGPLFHALDNEVSWLHAKWKQFRHLYATPETVDLLNEAAGFFFRVVQDMMWEDAVLHVTRLTDPPSTGRKHKKHNLTLLRLPPAIALAELSTRVGGFVAKAEAAAAFARDWRNRHIAHRDLHLALGSGAEPLMAASRSHMETALSHIRDAMNAVNGHYWGSMTDYVRFLAHDDAAALTHNLRAALAARKRKHKRWSEGIYLPEDFKPEDEV